MSLVAAVLAFGALPFGVQSGDGLLKAEVDPDTASVTRLDWGGSSHVVDLHGRLGGGQLLARSVTRAAGGGAVIARLFCMPGTDLPCSHRQAWVNLSLTPEADCVRLEVAVEGVRVAGAVNFTAPAVLGLLFEDTTALQLWAPWNRGSDGGHDALSPSDGGFGWWTGSYAHGTPLGGHGDFVVAEHASVLAPEDGAALSLIGDMGNEPSPLSWFNTSQEGGLAHSYHQLRLHPGVVHRRVHYLVPHRASCWRVGLAWSVARWPSYWNPTFAGARSLDGLGSYSSYRGNITAPEWREMGYKTSWDLSGRFFPYMGQFLPPMPNSTATWANDKEGTQKPTQVSYALVNEYYRRTQAAGFNTLSYWNVFEYGQNIVHGSGPGTVPAAIDERHWLNASQYLEDNFRPALVTNFACAHGGPCRSSNFEPRLNQSMGSWQGSVVVDPTPGLGYYASLMSQLRRKLSRLGSFQGLVVDRSDWNQVRQPRGQPRLCHR